MSNLFYEQLERGYHGIPEGFIPLDVIKGIILQLTKDRDFCCGGDQYSHGKYVAYDVCIDMLMAKIKEYER